jgi:hypothetical protein
MDSVWGLMSKIEKKENPWNLGHWLNSEGWR